MGRYAVALWILGAGCGGGEPAALPEDFAGQLERGAVCPRDPFGRPFGQVMLMNPGNTIRMQLQLPQDAPGSAVVFVGEYLDAYVDDDICDDVVSSSGPSQVIRMAYQLTDGTITYTAGDEVVGIQIAGAVLTPSADYIAAGGAFTASDVAQTPVLQLGDLDFGDVPIGVVLAPVE